MFFLHMLTACFLEFFQNLHIIADKTKRTVKKLIKEKFLNLVNACKNDRDMLDIIESDMRALGDYVYTVHMMETALPITRINYEGQELRDRIEKLDHNRRAHHERAIIGVKRLNRFAEMEGVEKNLYW